MKNFWMAAAISLVCCSSLAAAAAEPNDPNYPKDPNVLLRRKYEAVIAVLRDEKIDDKEKGKRISKLVRPVFDFDLMAKLSLGRKHWPKLTTRQRRRFTTLFRDLLETSYLNKVKAFRGQQASFKPAVRKGKTIQIPMELPSERENEKVHVLYKLCRRHGRWRIYDVEIQGVSILLSYRAQFDDILRNGTVEDLLARLEKTPDD